MRFHKRNSSYSLCYVWKPKFLSIRSIAIFTIYMYMYIFQAINLVLRKCDSIWSCLIDMKKVLFFWRVLLFILYHAQRLRKQCIYSLFIKVYITGIRSLTDYFICHRLVCYVLNRPMERFGYYQWNKSYHNSFGVKTVTKTAWSWLIKPC